MIFDDDLSSWDLPHTQAVAHAQRASLSRKITRTSSAPSRTSSTAPIILPTDEVTYTPTTHRISKAKKGKKVHACGFPGCPKIFTRAEHRK